MSRSAYSTPGKKGKYDKQNHPQNRIGIVSDNENIKDARPQRPSLVSAVAVSAWLPSL